MRVQRLLATDGIGGYYWRDQEAIGQGAPRDGFLYRGAPVTPGFTSIIQVSSTVLLTGVADDGSELYGDCATVNHAFRSGRQQAPDAASLIAQAEGPLSRWLAQCDLSSFRDAAAQLDTMRLDGQPLHMALRYGLSQLLLQAVAAHHRVTMAEILAREYGLTLADTPCDLLGSCGGNWYENVDKAIVRELPYFPQTAMVRTDQLDELPAYAEWISQRIRAVGRPDFFPTLHYDLHGLLSQRVGDDLDAALVYLRKVEAASAPYPVLFEDPLDAGERGAQIALMGRLREALRRAGSGIRLIADEWCNTREDVREFVAQGCCDLIQIKMPDLGGVDNTVQACLICRDGGVGVYLGGSCNETDISARVAAHVALAVRPVEFLGKPGLGLDEGVMIVTNEMQRAIRSYQTRLSAA
ncbi:methylaspartate ammonia-lyase [Bordetella bronchiseptica]|uniref:methylaspartate ammonia-lyase n=1 Tax=Bordetella bronchiseptica TaxID=518 RepID=UPI000461EA62|nr:methylaspartate ammonia-lyase [Bordetella bronchiseptica]AWP76398.1 methylaspartate ammonia-lyase [Bordetella bronchiseptica]AWP81240.1 methylaspartate ammonia-lyase [Bordetella bronchiseptica]AZW13920.1 methylaspartate ammonia-lyase [Bordetella bronchiseptica]KDB59633.1 methylaspartate ammonia-lyase [Bordetella bronchiseptica B18-5 (C3)]KDB67225.1 methylaspartate ammonia-lyase [Bordetella bronchiseptica A1-7]